MRLKKDTYLNELTSSKPLLKSSFLLKRVLKTKSEECILKISEFFFKIKDINQNLE